MRSPAEFQTTPGLWLQSRKDFYFLYRLTAKIGQRTVLRTKSLLKNNRKNPSSS